VRLVTICRIGRCVSINRISLDYLRRMACNSAMFTIKIISGHLVDGPICQKCNGIARLVGTERHPVMRELTALTFECARCAAVHVTMAVPEHQGDDHAR
jgi:hypothetical protein